MNFKLDNQKRWWRTIIRNDLRDLFKLAGPEAFVWKLQKRKTGNLSPFGTKARVSAWTVRSEKSGELLILECEIKSTKSDPNQVKRKIVERRGKRLRLSTFERSTKRRLWRAFHNPAGDSAASRNYSFWKLADIKLVTWILMCRSSGSGVDI